MVTDLSIIKEIQPLFKNDIVLYGTGSYGKAIYSELKSVGINIEFFCETYPKSKYLYNIPILSQKQLSTFCNNKKILIVIASSYFDEIYEDLQYKKIRGIGIVTALAVRYAIFLNIHTSYFQFECQKKCLMKINLWKDLKMKKQKSVKNAENFLQLLNLERENIFLIYQPGKVGSTSIQESLENKEIFSEHIHIINNRLLMKNKNYANIVADLKMKKIKIITGVREPVERAISSFVHLMQAYKSLMMDKLLSNDLCESCIQYLIQYCCNDNLPKYNVPKFNDNEFTLMNDLMGNEFTWFDKEIKEVFNIDIFDYSFDKEKGYSIIKKDNIEIFLYKLEKLNNLEKELGEFIGIKDFYLKYSNNGLEKMTKYIYKEIKNSIKIPQFCLDYYYKDNNKMKYFYTTEEIDEFSKKWKRKKGEEL